MEFLRLEASEKARRKVVGWTHASISVERVVGILLLLAGALGIRVCLLFLRLGFSWQKFWITRIPTL